MNKSHRRTLIERYGTVDLMRCHRVYSPEERSLGCYRLRRPAVKMNNMKDMPIGRSRPLFYSMTAQNGRQ
jgi:hypothetical protein